MKNIIVALLLFAQLFSINNLYAEQTNSTYHFSNLNLKDGLSQLSVLSILQDSKWCLWFGTRNGLNRYDGSKFTIFRHNSTDSLSLSDSHITALAEDFDQNLWIGTNNGLNCLDLKTHKITPFLSQKNVMFSAGIRSLCIDSRGRLLVGTSIGMCMYVKESNQFTPIELSAKKKGLFISSIYETTDHQLLIGTSTEGIYVCDLNMKVLNHLSTQTVGKSLPSDGVSAIYEDSKKQIWVGTTSGGIAKVDLTNGQIISYTTENSPLPNNNIRCFTEHDGVLFIGTFDGVCTVNLGDSLFNCSKVTVEKGNLSHFSVYSLLVDSSGTLWVGTYAGGINYFNKYANRFILHKPMGNNGPFLGIYGAMGYHSGHLFVATEGSGLLDYDIHTGRYQHHLIDHSPHSQHNRNILKAVMIEGNKVWCGTNKGSIYQFDTRTKTFSLSYQFPNDMSIYSITRTSDGKIWVLTSNPSRGIIRFKNLDSGRLGSVQCDTPAELSTIGSARCMIEAQPGIYLFGTRNSGLIKYDEHHQKRTNYNVDLPEGKRIYSNYVTSIIHDSSGRIWVGTFGGGISLFDMQQGVVETLTRQQGLPEDEICAIVEDQHKNLWISSNNGISKFSPTRKEFINYDRFNGMGVQELTPHSGLLLPNGEIAFSGSNGFVTFHPKDMKKNPFLPPIIFTDLIINNKIELPSESGLLTRTLDDVPRIELDYNQNNLSIGYCALNYTFPQQNQYAYRLQEYDKQWNYVGNRQEAFYTNLPAGSYTFEVKAANNDGVWNNNSRTLKIIVHPPLWKTWYAYTLYATLSLTLLSLIMYYIIKKQKLERELVFKQKEKQQLEEFHQTKIRLFTNFSHELRTPLTLIISPLQELLQVAEFNTNIKNKLSLIYSNSQRLLLLVNQLMDIRKSQAGKMALQIGQDDICSFVMEIYYAFNHIAISNGISFTFEKREEQTMAWFDKLLFEKVVFNLLSNAFKFTKSGDQVVLSISQSRYTDLPQEQKTELKNFPPETPFLFLSVADTGKGIPEHEIKNIFSPFYQITDKQSAVTVGTGIGLSLAQTIVQLHHGVIWAESNQPNGALFKVLIPISKSVYSETEIATPQGNRVVSDVIPPDVTNSKLEIKKTHTLLLVEDNNEVRTYIKECLEPYFYVIEADNGEDAFSIAVDKYPDLIVSDIMMPRKNGLELCTWIKEDLRVAHIPVILMTARSMVVQIKEGFSVGADDYIVKPFNMDVLIYRIKNLLESRDKLKKIFGKRFSPESLGIEIVSGRDDLFTQKFFETIKNNITNPDLNIDLLSKEIGLSRANLYRKLKAITELSPTELIRNTRLEIAAKLLMESDCSVSEISFQVGFNSHAYFTSSFKALYGYSPSEFVQKQK